MLDASRPNRFASLPALLRDHQTLREWPVVIHPLRLAPKSSPLSHFHHFLAAILVRALCPNGFPASESHLHTRARNPHLLPRRRAQMHFDSPLRFVVTDLVREPRQIKIRAEFSVESPQQISVERRRHTGWIVIRKFHLVDWLFQIRRKQQRVSRMQNRMDVAEEFVSRVPVEISNRAAKEQHEHALARLPPRSDVEQSVQVRALESHNADAVDSPEFLPASRKRRSRNVDRVIRDGLPPCQRFEYPSSFRAASASQFRDHDRLRQAVNNVLGVALQQTRARARQPVLRQQADHFEERRAEFIVQVFRRQFFLPTL